MAFPTSENLIEILTPVAARHGVDIEGIKAVPAGKKSQVKVLVDADNHPDLDLLEVISAEVSQALDAAEETGKISMGAGYTLEVSTPGVDHPLSLPRHWRRNRGRIVNVERTGFPPVIGRIGALNEDTAKVVLIQPAKKNPQVEIMELASVDRAVVQIEFSQVPAAQAEMVNLGFDEAVDQATKWSEENK
ncbi:ribosome maturation factor RimP [Corynebacterium caspium]|uniref:ribosome maturation factor RimP n=1 Tax=Corynebacterium caspium TaxID=234828 RepID=UPI00035E462C|nr:ribosome maturation factor RimP [Corynebacterium caspium]WKD59086.1 Ribosome maturation factor RimP [Corynebacterium caspium DSM 44850]